MTYPHNDMGKPEDLSFEELMAQSSVSGDTDPALDEVCTDEEADGFAARYGRSEAANDAVLQAAEQVVHHAATRNHTRQLVSAGAAGPTVEQAIASFRRDIDAVEYTRPPIVVRTDTTAPARAEQETQTPADTSTETPARRDNEPAEHTRHPAVVSSDTTDIFARLKSAAFHDLVHSSVAGDREAVAILFTWIRPAVVRYSRSRIGRDHSQSYSAADKVAEEICLAVVQALARYEDKPQSFLPFVYGIAAHKVAIYYRCERRNRVVPAVEKTEEAPEQTILAADLKDRLAKLLNTLPPRQREVLVLRMIVGLSAQETAEAVGLTPTAVRVTQNRAIAKLRNSLSPSEWV